MQIHVDALISMLNMLRNSGTTDFVHVDIRGVNGVELYMSNSGDTRKQGLPNQSKTEQNSKSAIDQEKNLFAQKKNKSRLRQKNKTVESQSTQQ